MGRAWALFGSSAVQTSRPVSMSKTCIRLSSVPATNTNPPPVIMAPPRLIEPGGSGAPGASSAKDPSGTFQRMAPFSMSTATSMPHGGGEQGMPDGARKLERAIA